MRAMTIDGAGGPEALTLAEVPIPSKYNSEVLVKVIAAAINPIDAKTRAGGGVSAGLELPGDPGIRLQRHRRRAAVRGLPAAGPATRCSG